MGNVVPLSAVAGRADVLRLIETGVFIFTTFGGDALSATGALATINALEKVGTYAQLWRIGGLMQTVIEKGINKYNLRDTVSFSDLGPRSGGTFNDAGSLTDLDIQSVYSFYMTANGRISLGINNICKSHTFGFCDESQKSEIIGGKLQQVRWQQKLNHR